MEKQTWLHALLNPNRKKKSRLSSPILSSYSQMNWQWPILEPMGGNIPASMCAPPDLLSYQDCTQVDV